MIGAKVVLTAIVIFVLLVILTTVQKPESGSAKLIVGSLVLLCLLSITGGLIATIWGF